MYNLFLWKIVKFAFKNESYKLFFQEHAKIARKKKIVHNFLITNPNGMNQRFPWRQKSTFYKTNKIVHNPLIINPDRMKTSFTSIQKLYCFTTQKTKWIFHFFLICWFSNSTSVLYFLLYNFFWAPNKI